MFNKNVFTQTDVVADLIKGINEADYKAKMEALKGNQHKIDKNKNNKIDAHDFKILRGEKKVNEEEIEEGMLNQLRDRGNVATGQKQQDRKNFDTNTGAALKPNSTISGIRAKMQNKVQEEAEEVEEDSSVKIPTPTGTRVLGHRYGNAAKTHRDSMADPFAVVKGPGQKDIEALEKKKVKKEEIDPEKVTTDTLAGRVKGKTANPFAPKKVMMDVPDNVKEEAEQIDELSKDTLKSYSAKAKASAKSHRDAGNQYDSDPDERAFAPNQYKKAASRTAGAAKADSRIKEEYDQVDERTLTPGETSEKERIVKGMKKSLSGFKARYGKDAKSVMYATATKAAKKD